MLLESEKDIVMQMVKDIESYNYTIGEYLEFVQSHDRYKFDMLMDKPDVFNIISSVISHKLMK